MRRGWLKYPRSHQESPLIPGTGATLSVLFPAALFGAIGRAAVMPAAQVTAASFFGEDTAR
jgi:hypothetical protein